MKNLFVVTTIFFATLLMWLMGSAEASAQEVIASPNADYAITINGDEISLDGETISLDGGKVIINNRHGKGGNITINGVTIDYNDSRDIHKIVGSKEHTTREVELTKGFNYIFASRGVKVVMSEKKGNTATIEANSNIIDYVICENDNGTLKVGIDDDVNSISNLYVVVTIPRRDNINVYRVTSAANITIYPTLDTSNVSLEATSAGSINLTRINCDKLLIDATSAASVSGGFRVKEKALVEASSAANVTVSLLGEYASLHASSAANIKASGQVNRLDIDASSAAKIRAQELNSVKAEADASSGASIYVNCDKELDAEASSGGDVHYKGECKVERSTSSGGSVKRL